MADCTRVKTPGNQRSHILPKRERQENHLVKSATGEKGDLRFRVGSGWGYWMRCVFCFWFCWVEDKITGKCIFCGDVLGCLMVVNIHPLCDLKQFLKHFGWCIAAVPNVTPVPHKEQLREKEIEREKEASQDVCTPRKINMEPKNHLL